MSYQTTSKVLEWIIYIQLLNVITGTPKCKEIDW